MDETNQEQDGFSLADVIEVTDELERGEWSAPEAIERLTAARVYLLRLSASLRRHAANIASDPAEVKLIASRAKLIEQTIGE